VSVSGILRVRLTSDIKIAVPGCFVGLIARFAPGLIENPVFGGTDLDLQFDSALWCVQQRNS
jgi:hypothetical protein